MTDVTAAEIFGDGPPVELTTRPLLTQLLERARFYSLEKGAHAEDVRDALERLKGEITTARPKLDATDRATIEKLALDHLASQKIANARPVVRAILGPLTAPKVEKIASSDTPPLVLSDDEPSSGPVDGAALLAETSALIRRHVVLSAVQADTAALWSAAAHAIDGLDRMAMLLLSSPTPECGKTTAAMVMSGIVPRPIMVASLTPAVLFRLVHAYRPTLIADEVDSWLSDEKSELRGVFNAAHWRTGAVIPRCVGDDNRVELFNVFGPKLIAMIGRPPATMLSRSIMVTLRRKTPTERVEPLREDRLRADLAPLRQQWRRWALDHQDRLRSHEPMMPSDLPINRATDNWRPLLSIADLAGGDWPGRARAAALELSGVRLSDDEPINIALLADVRAVFGDRQDPAYLSSEDIIGALKEMSERPWADWNKGRGLSAAQLASRLRDFGAGPLGLRTRKTRLDVTRTAQRWHRVDFSDAWSRYLPPDLPSDPPHPEQTNESGQKVTIPNPEQSTNVPGSKTPVQPMFTDLVPGVPVSEPDPEEEDSDGYQF